MPAFGPVSRALPQPSVARQVAIIVLAFIVAAWSTVALNAPAPVAAASFSIIRTINAHAWAKPSTDPTGVAYDSATGRMIVVDSEIDEAPAPHYAGANVWEMSLTGSVVRTWNTLAYTDEPADAAFNPANGRLYIVDDDLDEVFVVSRGGDGQFGTGDDGVSSFDTTMYGSTDPSGITFGAGYMFIADGLPAEIFRIHPGPNRTFGNGDDTVIHFDVASRGQTDPEGIAYDPRSNSLFIVTDRVYSDLLHVTLSGATLQNIDLGFVPNRVPGGLTLARSSGSSGVLSLWLADRGVDNDIDPNENDGRIFELTAPATPFTDIGSSIFKGDIEWLFGSGITKGCTTTAFCPNSVVTREQMASFLARARNLPAASRDFFTDDENSVHEADINRVAQAGIAAGCGGGRYCPTRTISREEMASFLARAFNLPATGSDFFTDDESSIHEADINRVAAAGIATGCGGSRYCPRAGVTRGQMAAFLRRALT
jgi:S-layer homology domain